MKLFELFDDFILESLNDHRLLHFFTKWAHQLPDKSDVNVVVYFFKNKIAIKKQKNAGKTDVSKKHSAVMNFFSQEQLKDFLMELKTKFSGSYDILLCDSVINEDLRNWFKQKWVDVSRKVGNKHPPCGASSGSKKRGESGKRAYPKCVPQRVAKTMSASDKAKATRRKRRAMSAHRGKNPVYAKTF